MDFRTLSIDDTLKKLNTSIKGLNNDEVLKRKKKYGLNKFNLYNKFWKVFFVQIFNPIILTLLISLILTIINKSYFDLIYICVIILIIMLFNTILEYKCEYPIKFNKLRNKKALVIRNGRKTRINPKKITIGDILVIEKNSYIKADMKVIVANDIKISSPLNNTQNDILLAGDYVIDGGGMGVVYEIGKNTEIYKLAKKTSQKRKQKLPFKIKLKKINRKISLFTFIITLLLGLILYLKKTSYTSIISYLITLIISSIHIFYIVILVLILYYFKKLISKNITINTFNLLGSIGDTTTLIFNKDDILTLNEMSAKVVELEDGSIYNIEGSGYNDIGEVIPITPSARYKDSLYNLNLLGKLVYLNNKATLSYEDGESKYSGNAFDIALLALNQKINHCIFEDKIVHEINNENYCITFYKENEITKVSIRGNVEKILDFCNNDKEQILEQYNHLKSLGYKVIGVIEGITSKSKGKKKYSEKDIKKGNFIGLIGFINPLKETSEELIKVCEKEGIKVIITCNEDANTTEIFGKELNLISKRNEIGSEEDVIHNFNLGERIFDDFVKETKIYSNISNESLIKVIDSLKRKGEIVTTIGNNVDDIDVLKNSNISITDSNSLIKSSSDLVINDNNLETIIDCIKKSKNISNVVFNIIDYLFYSKIIEVLIIFLSIIFNPDIKLLLNQILWIDLSCSILSLGLVLNNNFINDDNYTKRIVLTKKEAFKWILTSISSVIVVFIFILLNTKFSLIKTNMNYSITILIIFIQSFFLFYYQDKNNSIFKPNLKDKWKLYLFIVMFLSIQLLVLKYLIKIKTITILITLGYSLILLTIIEIIKFIRKKVGV